VRVCIPNAITPNQAVSLRSKIEYLSFEDPRLSKILTLVQNSCNASIDSPAYVRVECKKEGHPWHTDVGNTGHMSWCRYSARVLLNPQKHFTGGEFYFKDEPNTPIYGYRQLWVYDHISENTHFIASHKGQRSVLLMFFT
tara:strand:+ start:1144 stop:1563 length:420 start_codon:yes stop_codon:yes gene_type:complete